MPVYNCAPYLAAALESMAYQTFTNFELIIIDDGSRDDSLAIIKSWAARDARIRFKSRPNTGICGALNEALEMAVAPLIARMDGDDTCSPNRLERQRRFMQSNPDVICCGTALLYTDPKERPLFATKPSLMHAQIEREFLQGHSMALVHATAIFRASVIKAVGYRQKYQFIEDLDLFLRMLGKGRFANIPEVLYSYRQHPNGTNATRFRQQQELKQQLLTEVYAERSLPAPVVSLELAQTPTLGELYADWSCKAFLGGNPKAGFIYAFRFLFAEKITATRVVRFTKMLRLVRLGSHKD